MRIKLTKAKARLIRFSAGLTAVLVSPFISSGIAQRAAELSTVVSSAVGYTELQPLTMNNEGLLLYKPDGDNSVTVEPFTLPEEADEAEETEQAQTTTTVTEATATETTVTETTATETTATTATQPPETTATQPPETTTTQPPETTTTRPPETTTAKTRPPYITTQEHIYDPRPEDEAATVISRNIHYADEDFSKYTANSGPIEKKQIGNIGGDHYINLKNGGQIWNLTDLSANEILAEIKNKPEFTISKCSEPEVLIIHTHSTEAYQPTERNYYDSDYLSRSLNAENSVVAVGSVIAQSIAEAGISVIHDGTMHDEPFYVGAYERSAETVKRLLKEFPSIKVVLDVHRDALIYDEVLVAPIAEINGEDVAQVMIISAVDDGDEYFVPDFRKNLRLAALFQEQFESDNPGITRPVLFQYCQYNQDLSPGSLLLEIGTNGNTLPQALRTGKLVGQSIGKVLTELSESDD